MKKYLAGIITVIVGILMLAGCGGGGEKPPVANGNVRVMIALPGHVATTSRSISEIKKGRVTVAGAGMTTLTADAAVDIANKSVTVMVPEVKPGNDREVTFDGLDAAGNILYTGSTKVTVTTGQTVDANITATPTNSTVNIDIIVHEGTPTLVVDTPPAFGSTADLTGKITGGVNPANYVVAVFSHGTDGKWRNKPTYASYMTYPDNLGAWSTDITTGGDDQNAPEFLVFLVPVETYTDIPNFYSNSLAPTVASAVDQVQIPRPAQ
ncbi:MAG: hypothetical protein WC227_04210 [Patescibacteria group bacterium]|jgi:hypothetical protein